jgi:hypothetical protein
VIGALPAAPSSSPSANGSGAITGTGSVEEAAFVRTGILSAACSTVSNFIQGVLNSVFSALQFETSSSSGIGGFFKTVWNGAVSLAQQALQGLISAVTGPILNAIKTIAGTAAVIAQIASYLDPWAVKVTANPTSVDAGSGGTLTAKVDSGTGGTNYPSGVKDCAQAAGITLPALTAADAKATWELSAPISTGDDTAVTLDEQGSNNLAFTSSKSDSSACAAGSTDQTGVAKITVTRPDTDGLKQLATSMLTNGLGFAGSVIGPIITSILSPIIDSVLSRLNAITNVTGTGAVTVTGATSGNDCTSSTPTPSDTAPTPTADCLIGTWTQSGEHYAGGASLGGAGVELTLTADHLTQVYNGVAFSDGTWNGSETASASIVQLTPTTGTVAFANIVSSITVVTAQGDVLHPKLNPYSVDWTCSGNTMTLSAVEATGTLVANYGRSGQ